MDIRLKNRGWHINSLAFLSTVAEAEKMEAVL